MLVKHPTWCVKLSNIVEPTNVDNNVITFSQGSRDTITIVNAQRALLMLWKVAKYNANEAVRARVTLCKSLKYIHNSKSATDGGTADSYAIIF